jgi:hypothetical protein
MSDPTKRVANWDQAYDTALIKSRLDAKRAAMFVRVQAQFPALTMMEAQVKQVLDGQGVSVIQYPFYLCFGRELWHVTHEKEMSGSSAAKEAATLVAKWKDRGLSQAVLETIRSEVFSISAPAP